jgi:hypothetical protein
MPMEKRPAQPVHMIGRWPPPDHLSGYGYTVQDSDNWWSVGRKFGIDVWKLIEYNFNTRNPDEVNWYLRTLIGCKHSTPDGKNYTFRGASPGVIFIPPGHVQRVNVPSPPAPPAQLPGSRRNPTASEQRLYWDVFRDTLPDPYRIHIDDGLVNGAAMVRPDLVAFPTEWVLHMGPTAYHDCTQKRKHQVGERIDATFIHELTHVWQAYNNFFKNAPLLSALCSHAWVKVVGGSAYTYTPGKPWGDYNREQQAEIVQDWYKNGMKTSDPLYTYIEKHIRRAHD